MTYAGRHLSVSDVFEIIDTDGKVTKRLFVEPVGFRGISSPAWERHFEEVER